MGKITFSSKEARQQYRDCRRITAAHGDESLLRCMMRLRHWNNPIVIGRDFEIMSFTFREKLPSGRTGICGGIIYHGPRDGFGSGAAPTFSVTLDQAEGYRIHT